MTDTDGKRWASFWIDSYQSMDRIFKSHGLGGFGGDDGDFEFDRAGECLSGDDESHRVGWG